MLPVVNFMGYVVPLYGDQTASKSKDPLKEKTKKLQQPQCRKGQRNNFKGLRKPDTRKSISS